MSDLREISSLSSSDDDLPSHRVPTLNLPSVNLAKLRKKDKNKPKINLAKAKDRLTGAKSVRFPDSTNFRDSVLSTLSTTNVSSDLLDLDSEVGLVQAPGSTTLPNFSFNIPVEKMRQNEMLETEVSDSDEEYAEEFAQPMTYVEDTSDEEPRESRASRTSPSRASQSRTSPSRTSPFRTSLSHEMDITDQIRRTSSSDSNRSGDSGRRNTLRGIFREMSLADHDDGVSRSDNFLGRVLNFSGGNSGLSGGGMAPGASRREESIDEEREVGGLSEDHSIALQNLDFAELNEEAQNLISTHAPEHKYPEYPKVAFDTPDRTSEDKMEEGSSREHEYAHSRTDTETSSAFYQPNPDLLREDYDDDDDEDYLLGNAQDGYVAPPKQVHAGVLSSLLKLYQNSATKSTSSFASGTTTLADEQYADSGYSSKNVSTLDFSKHDFSKTLKMPKKLVGKFKKPSRTTPRESTDDSDAGDLDGDAAKLPSFQNARPKAPRTPKDTRLGKKLKGKREQRLRITVHIADILQRQRFIIRMCRALMLYGAPTHRLEEYMVMTSRVLEIDGQFVYFPGTMIVAFGDAATRTSEVHLVRCAQGLNLSKLADTHQVYKAVIHDLVGVEDATQKLDELMKRKNAYNPWICVFLYALGSASVCTWGFGGGWVDIPIAFGVGLAIGYLQFFVSSMSNLYSSVFEVTASILVSFVARGIGSINSGNTFCFGAIAQGSLALILPGYIILCGSLELQSKNIVAGSVRMFYAIIYSLFLGFGITLGAALYGWVDKNATDAATCSEGHSLDDKWRILFVPLFSLCLGLINQARFSQLPVMILISSIAYIGTFFAGKHFSNITEFTASIGAFIIGILGNLYSRIGKGMAVSAMLPAIFVQVPSGIASKSTLLAGLTTANKITNATSSTDASDLSSLSFGATMVEVAIGISVGLFAAALVVYPFGKRRTSLFTL